MSRILSLPSRSYHNSGTPLWCHCHERERGEEGKEVGQKKLTSTKNALSVLMAIKISPLA